MSEYQWVEFRAVDAPLDDAAIQGRNRPAYQRAAEELSVLARACGKSMAIAKVESIRAKFPTRNALSSELKKAGF
ncbi:hypothetical protein Mal15_67520 [Stieleria maiorica]|uniref:Uncharacterized protein n=1 Tax=Stieleria maiorica TaxID=2795974 RepID=A0A5B9MQU8_9BACT|nr:hypothetical protein [Stieleria maiorica]QEG02631.1 hypothetical protein Mal15_67520 [Stieleria maiorica]